VGSQSVAQALEAAGVANLIHTHSEFEFGINYLGTVLTFSQLLQVKHVSTRVPAPRLISGVRDPVSWALSAMGRSARVGDQALPGDPASLALRIRQILGGALHWFEHDYFVGLNVYEHPYEPNVGWGIAEHGRSRLLLYRLDRLPELGPVLEDFTGLTGLKLPRVDVSRDSAERRRLEGWLRESPEFEALVREIYRSPYARHFFTPAERAERVDRWLAPAV
jgi:hypothetical protein